ncbi:MAG: hypothetical protein Q8R02_09435 [Hyphomonadaceae bacterium]|nr:hypothetical protein [Hyphomonadaceae bacterium]
MFHDLLQWLQDVPGATDGDPATSWSQQFAGSLHLWALTEGTHVLSLILFAGTILMVDLRMLGIAFRSVPYSTLNNRVLPLTIAGFALATVTGVLLFLSNPVHYYHSVFFRAKVIFILVAAANIFWFHYRVQKNLAEWDTRPSPPLAVKLAAGVSISAWILVIVFGRLMALSFFECENMPKGTFGYAFAECEPVMRGIEELEAQAAEEEAAAAEESTEESEPAEDPAPAEEAPAQQEPEE